MPANNRSAVSGGLNLSLESLGVNLPYSMEAEQAVLGAAILDADIIPKMVETLRPEMFYARQNGEIFSEIVRLFTGSAPVDFVTLLAAVQDAAVFETEDAAKVYLTQLAETVPSLSHTDTYVKIIAEKYRVRQLMNAAKTILEQTGEETDADLLLESAEQKIYEIRSGRDSTALTPISSVIIDTYAHLQEISGPNKDKYLGIPTGFNYLDTMLTGLGRSDLIILAARPGMGKTSFALNIATNVAKKQNVPVAVFSLEMTKDQLVSRILSSEAAIDSQAFRTGGLSGGLGGPGPRVRGAGQDPYLSGRYVEYHHPGDEGEDPPHQSGPGAPGHRAAHHRLSAAYEHGQAHGEPRAGDQ